MIPEITSIKVCTNDTLTTFIHIHIYFICIYIYIYWRQRVVYFEGSIKLGDTKQIRYKYIYLYIYVCIA